VKLVTRDLQLMPLMSCVFRENRYGDSSTLLMGTNEILLVIKEIFLSDLKKKLGTETFQNKVLISIKFCEKRC